MVPRFVRARAVLRRVGALGVLLLALGSGPALAQPTVEVSGLAYIDYLYVIEDPDSALVGYNTFDYRRIYLTTDFTLSDRFEGRVRFEARGRSPALATRPLPYVRDMYVVWRDPLGAGSRLRFGVQTVPLFDVAQRVWGYRSLERMLLSRTRLGDSRDFGLRADVPFAADGALRFAAMFGNGNGVSPEPSEAVDGKHLYGQIQYVPEGPIRATLGADYRSISIEDDPRSSVFRVSGFVGAVTERARVGVEAFYLRNRFRFDDDNSDNVDGLGLSAFAAVNLTARTSLVGRIDSVDDDARGGRGDERYYLAAFAYRPDPRVELMPNIVISDVEDVDPEVQGRFTVHVRF